MKILDTLSGVFIGGALGEKRGMVVGIVTAVIGVAALLAVAFITIKLLSPRIERNVSAEVSEATVKAVEARQYPRDPSTTLPIIITANEKASMSAKLPKFAEEAGQLSAVITKRIDRGIFKRMVRRIAGVYDAKMFGAYDGLNKAFMTAGTPFTDDVVDFLKEMRDGLESDKELYIANLPSGMKEDPIAIGIFISLVAFTFIQLYISGQIDKPTPRGSPDLDNNDAYDVSTGPSGETMPIPKSSPPSTSSFMGIY